MYYVDFAVYLLKKIYLLFYSVPRFFGIFKSNNKSFLSFLTRVRWYDTDCNAKSALAAAVDAKSKFDPHLFLGPPCSAGWYIYKRAQETKLPEEPLSRTKLCLGVILTCMHTKLNIQFLNLKE